ncbi:MAG: hypothetical protein D6732_14360 [Methanobacteriota archaeon]|nr:MAG: hypothetical protein D6732_14360 [Euryarchaeota archaeon]
MKVVFQYQGLLTERYKSKFLKNLPEEIQLVFMETRDQEKFLQEMEDADILVGYRITPELMERAKKLKHIQIPWTGFDNLGKEHLKGRNDITVSNSHANSLAIAEHGISLLLAAAKLLTQRDMGMRKGDWTSRYEEVNSVWLTGKTASIIGYGAIGKKMARMLKNGFGMEILAIKRHPDEEDDIAEFVGRPDQLQEVLPKSDFVIVAVPLTDETKGMIRDEHFDLMKSTAVLVNIARGPVIEEKALYDALAKGKIHSAGIDVWYNYPRGDQRIIFQNYPFEKLPNIVMTPHSAFKIVDREEVFVEDIIENIRRIFEGKPPINQVNLELGY